MKKVTLFLLFSSIVCFKSTLSAQGILNRIKDKTKQRADAKVDNTIDKGLDKADDATKTTGTGGNNENKNENTGNNNTPDNKNDKAIAGQPDLKTYGNYDFVPGDTILFEDHFTDDQEGEFPAHWHLGSGQALMNVVSGYRALLLTSGNYAHVSPLIKSAAYLPGAFTIEFDCYTIGGYPPHLYFYDNSTDAQNASNVLGQVSLSWSNVEVSAGNVNLSGDFPADIRGETFYNKWHHVAMAYRNNQLKVYMDQYRILVVPGLGIVPHAFDIEGIGDIKTPIILANFRIAKGGGMNMLGKKFTDAKIITHGINFDIDKAIIKPESMGTLNMIVKVLKENPDLKFEVDGHTDNSGATAHNLTLSQQRADAVKTQLVNMGVDESRLTSKGFGDTKPIGDNSTAEGKANNRRVEFVKK